ncbi:MAG: hypothetical protein JKY66_09370 [Spongiibacteraceae bacterium]|nr:hypothetical protein [Spongiibacteraceae bacterium]
MKVTQGLSKVITLFILVCLSLYIQAEPPKNSASVSLTLLGTGGGPGGNKQRAGIASLLSVNSHYVGEDLYQLTIE